MARPAESEPLSYAEAEAGLRQIVEILKRLRTSDVPLIQNYAISMMAETQAILLMGSLTDPPGPMEAGENFYRVSAGV